MSGPKACAGSRWLPFPGLSNPCPDVPCLSQMRPRLGPRWLQTFSPSATASMEAVRTGPVRGRPPGLISFVLHTLFSVLPHRAWPTAVDRGGDRRLLAPFPSRGPPQPVGSLLQRHPKRRRRQDRRRSPRRRRRAAPPVGLQRPQFVHDFACLLSARFWGAVRLFEGACVPPGYRRDRIRWER